MQQLDLSFVQTFSFINTHTATSQNLVKHYIAKYHVNSVRDIFAPTGTAHAYDLVHLLVKAIEKAQVPDRDKIRDALEELESYTGVVKTYKQPFTKDRHEALSSMDFQMARFAADGVIVPLVRK